MSAQQGTCWSLVFRKIVSFSKLWCQTPLGRDTTNMKFILYINLKFRNQTNIAVTVETCTCTCIYCKSLFMRHSSSGWLISNISLFQTRVLWQTIHLFMSGCYQAVDRPMLVQEKRHRATLRWMFYVKWTMAEQSGCLSERLAHCKDTKHHM